MKYLFLFLLCSLILLACSSRIDYTEEVPEPTLAPEQMSAVLRDLFLIEAKLTEYSSGREKDSTAEALYLQLMANYGIDSSEFNANIRAYVYRPKLLEQSSEEALNALRELEIAYPSLREEGQ